jgi:hypothetical protein
LEQPIEIRVVFVRNDTWFRSFSTTNRIRYFFGFVSGVISGKNVDRCLFRSAKTLGALVLQAYTWICLHSLSIQTLSANLCDCICKYRMLNYQLVDNKMTSILPAKCLWEEKFSVATSLPPYMLPARKTHDTDVKKHKLQPHRLTWLVWTRIGLETQCLEIESDKLTMTLRFWKRCAPEASSGILRKNSPISCLISHWTGKWLVPDMQLGYNVKVSQRLLSVQLFRTGAGTTTRTTSPYIRVSTVYLAPLTCCRACDKKSSPPTHPKMKSRFL